MSKKHSILAVRRRPSLRILLSILAILKGECTLGTKLVFRHDMFTLKLHRDFCLQLVSTLKLCFFLLLSEIHYKTSKIPVKYKYMNGICKILRFFHDFAKANTLDCSQDGTCGSFRYSIKIDRCPSNFIIVKIRLHIFSACFYGEWSIQVILDI